MEFNWTTFLLEIINFLVLVWILKRFLYRPVLNIIARRQQDVEQLLQETTAERQSSEALKVRYENRLADWEQEKEGVRRTLQQEMEAARRRGLDELAGELDDERKKQQVLSERKQQESEHLAEIQALSLGADFTARLLQRLASPELEARLIKVAIDDLDTMSAEQREVVARAWSNGNGAIEVTTAYPLDQARQESLRQALARLIDEEVQCNFRQDPELIGGVRLKIDHSVLHANLQDELKGFVEASRDC
ncbi:MAG: ATPase [Halieaceae bacterium]|nr:ATPase [Halieaceae bacterium]